MHAELMTQHLPSWLTSSMVRYEMPYPLMVSAHPENVNRIVRPLLDTSIIDRVAQIQWTRTPFRIVDYIICISLILEMLATRKVTLLVNKDILKHKEKGWPLPYLWLDSDASIHCGEKRGPSWNRTGHHGGTAIAVLAPGATQNLDHTRHIHQLAFDSANASARNPLNKFGEIIMTHNDAR